MNGKEINGKIIYVGRAQKRLERQGELKRKFDQIKQDRIQRYQVLLHIMFMGIILSDYSATLLSAFMVLHLPDFRLGRRSLSFYHFLFQGVNLYVKNLDDSIDDDRLRKEFAPYGTITSAKVL